MGRKLYPPYIDGKNPAFCGTNMRIWFRHNRAIGASQYSSISCKIKTVSTNEWKWTLNSDQIYQDSVTGNWYVDYNLAQTNPKTNQTYASMLSIGLFYKIQIAYVDTDGVIGYFSDVGVIKYTSVPKVYIDGLKAETNASQTNYVGVYSQADSGQDSTEKVYSYKFTILDESGNVFLESGEQLHNSSTDTESNKSRDIFKCNKEMIANRKYRLNYSVTTINGLECASSTYLIMRSSTVRPAINAKLRAKSDFEDGYILVYLEADEAVTATGSFSICRSSSLDNFETWDELCQIELIQECALKDLFKDFAIEQGVQYCYSLQQFNTYGLYSNRMLSDTVSADFEDMFLYDGKRQLKIRFNPNVSSFKNDILETKTDTIGGRYPFIFRNGNVKYKEFPITGLLSYLADENEYFLEKNKLGRLEMETTDLISDNIRAERMFKLEVLDWLNNGEAKLFKSPTEGNYLVRLLNVSMSPNATLGRMLHTFTATAYEIGDTDFDTLNTYSMFDVYENIEKTVMQFMTLNLAGDEQEDGTIKDPVKALISGSAIPKRETLISKVNSAKQNTIKQSLNIPYIYLGEISKETPGAIFALQYDQEVNGTDISFITIGGTGVYEINTKDNPVIGIYPMWTPDPTGIMQGLFTFGYYAENITDAFSQVYKYYPEDILAQFIGKHNDILTEDGLIYYTGTNNTSYNILQSSNNKTVRGIENFRNTVGRFYWLRFKTREIINFYPHNITSGSTTRVEFCYDPGFEKRFVITEIIETNVYADQSQDPVRYYDGRDLVRLMVNNWNGSTFAAFPTSLINNENYYWTDDTREPWTSNSEDNYDVDRLYKFSINHSDRNIDIKAIGRYVLTDLEDVSHISIGRMLICDCYYQNTEILYSNEITGKKWRTGSAKSEWDSYNKAKNDLLRVWGFKVDDDSTAETTMEKLAKEDQSTVDNYIINLYKAEQVYNNKLKALTDQLT